MPLCAAMVSATLGTTSLCLGGVKPWTAYAAIWSVWWLGDAMGNLVVAPLLLTRECQVGRSDHRAAIFLDTGELLWHPDARSRHGSPAVPGRGPGQPTPAPGAALGRCRHVTCGFPERQSGRAENRKWL